MLLGLLAKAFGLPKFPHSLNLLYKISHLIEALTYNGHMNRQNLCNNDHATLLKCHKLILLLILQGLRHMILQK